MTKKNPKGEKFGEKYGVEPAQIYKGDTEALQIPHAMHPLFDPTAPTTFDEIRVAAIDRDGTMTTPIEVWTDPDEGILWVLDGRGRALDVREVNRRRKERKCDPVKPYIVPFKGDEKAAIARVREKNYHRRLPTPSGMAVDLSRLRRAGYSWADCATILHKETDNAEKWGRKLIPLAYCIPEVQQAVDAGELPRLIAHRFGGGKTDGSAALSHKAQVALLAEVRKEATKRKEAIAERPKAIPPKARERVVQAFSNGALARFEKKPDEQQVVRVIRATIDRLGGDTKALRHWPEVEAAFEEAIAPPPKPEKDERKAKNGRAGAAVRTATKPTEAE